MKKFTLSLLALIPALCISAETLDEAKTAAKAYLETCIASVPYGHDALTQGIERVNVATSIAGVNAAKKKATDGSLEEMRDDIYRVRVTVKNQGNGSYMSTPGDTKTPDEWTRPVAFVDKVDHQSIWIFNYCSDGRFTLMSNDRCYIGTEFNKSDPTLLGSTFMDTARHFAPEFSDDGHILLAYYEQSKSLSETGGTVITEEKRYLVATPNGTIDYVLSPSDANAEWTLARAYSGTALDGPKLTFDTANPVLYTVENGNGNGFLQVAGSNAWADVKTGQNEFSFWYFVDRGIGDGTMYIQNVNNERLVYNITGWRCFTSVSTNDKPFRPFVMEGYEQGLAFTVDVTHEYTTSTENTHCLGWTTSYDYRAAQLSRPSATDPKNFTWKMGLVSGTDAEAFANAKQSVRDDLAKWLTRSDFGQAVINAAMAEINDLPMDQFASMMEANTWLNNYKSETLTKYIAAINSEIVGNQLTLKNVRRTERGSNAMLGLLTTGVNTQAKPTHNSVWNAESAGNGYVRFCTIDGRYLGPASSSKTVEAVATAAQAGLYKITLQENGFSVVTSTNSNVGLNVDTNGSAAVGYSASDAGSIWTILSTAAIEQLEGGPQNTTGTKRKYYTIRNKATGNYMNGFGQSYYVSVGAPTVNSYWFLTNAGNGDGVRLTVDESNCSMIINAGDAITTTATGGVFYLVPRGTTAAEGYYIAASWPANEQYLCAYSSGASTHVAPRTLTDAIADQMTWIFDYCETIDYQGIYDTQADTQAAMLEGYLDVQPWGHDILKAAIAKVRGSWTDFDDSAVDLAIQKMQAYVASVLLQVEEEIEIVADGNVINITNIRRRDNNYRSGAHLAADGDDLITVNDPDEGQWVMEYVNNGRYRFHALGSNDYIAELPSVASRQVGVAHSAEAAGLYSLTLQQNSVTLINRSFPQWGLNVDMNGTPAVAYNSTDAGSRWHITLVAESSIKEVETDPTGGAIYNLQGRRVANPTHGIYIINGKKVCVK